MISDRLALWVAMQNLGGNPETIARAMTKLMPYFDVAAGKQFPLVSVPLDRDRASQSLHLALGLPVKDAIPLRRVNWPIEMDVPTKHLKKVVDEHLREKLGDHFFSHLYEQFIANLWGALAQRLTAAHWSATAAILQRILFAYLAAALLGDTKDMEAIEPLLEDYFFYRPIGYIKGSMWKFAVLVG